jgi:hypothetical protein
MKNPPLMAKPDLIVILRQVCDATRRLRQEEIAELGNIGDENGVVACTAHPAARAGESDKGRNSTFTAVPARRACVATVI